MSNSTGNITKFNENGLNQAQSIEVETKESADGLTDMMQRLERELSSELDL